MKILRTVFCLSIMGTFGCALGKIEGQKPPSKSPSEIIKDEQIATTKQKGFQINEFKWIYFPFGSGLYKTLDIKKMSN